MKEITSLRPRLEDVSTNSATFHFALCIDSAIEAKVPLEFQIEHGGFDFLRIYFPENLPGRFFAVFLVVRVTSLFFSQ